MGKRWRILAALAIVVFGIWFWLALPKSMFSAPVSEILLDRYGNLLQARRAADGQWRFPPGPAVPDRFAKALIAFEDHRFYRHPGIDFLAMGQAILQNLRAGKIVRGASTLTMQVMRLSVGKGRRTWRRKILETILSLRLELRCGKSEILAMYAANAPFGGNLVGVEAASWRYFGRSSSSLSWAEASLLAVLPNAPGLIHPGKNRQILLQKRNRLLHRLHQQGHFSASVFKLACLEPLPEKPIPLPQQAPWLLSSLGKGLLTKTKPSGSRYQTTIDPETQTQVSQILLRHRGQWVANGIENAAVLVMEIETGEVRAYLGNLPSVGTPVPEGDVDVLTSRRSPGSTLKPFLYEAMLTEGMLLPHTLLADIPTQFGSYAPRNFDPVFDGAVPADNALGRSLNIPMVRMLQQYGTARFLERLQRGGMHALDQPAWHYGLSLILGGGEVRMWELAGLYASMGRIVLHHSRHPKQYDPQDLRPPTVFRHQQLLQKLVPSIGISAAGAWWTFEAMQEQMRPGDELLWEQFRSAKQISWKTGTSFGFRDAWAIGLTPRFLVGVWVGNADGEGRPALIGLEAAAPVLFEVFRMLPGGNERFPKPTSELVPALVCRKSGHRALELCPETDTLSIPKAGLRSPACPYHQLVHLDAPGRHRVLADCYPPHQMRHVPWFVLPPAMEWYFKGKDPTYQPLPPWKEGCTPATNQVMMELLYPRKSARIFLPRESDGKKGRFVCKAAHRQTGAAIHWHLDQVFLGTTRDFHHMPVLTDPGWHRISLSDDAGERVEVSVEVVGE